MSEFNSANFFGWQASAQAWLSTVEADPNRVLLLDPIMLERCQSVAGKRVLDIGCGNGRFCRFLEARGAQCTGIDVIPVLIRSAKELGGGSYFVADGANLPFKSGSFDLVVSYLTLLDIEDFRGAISEAFRVLAPGGKFLCANVHSMASAWTGWVKDDQGSRLFYRVDRYFEERGEIAEWSGIRVFNWHRPLQSYFDAFLEAGFTLEFFCEPMPTVEASELEPSIADMRRVPNFIVFEWKKPATQN